MKTIRPLFILLFSLFTFHPSLFSQSPGWTDREQRKVLYPEDQYFTGYMQILVEKEENPDDKLGKARSDARAEATQSIQATVRTMSDYNTQELDLKIFEDFRYSVSVFSELTVQGMKVETFYNKKKRRAEAFAWIKKRDLMETSIKLYQVHEQQLVTKIREAANYNANNQPALSLAAYGSCLTLVRELQQDMILAIICGGDIPGKMPSDYEAEINMAVASIEKTPPVNLDDLCARIGNSLKKQHSLHERLILITPFTLEETQIGSPLSGRLLLTMEQKLSVLGFNVTTLAGKSDKALILSGVYWETEKALTFTFIVRDPGEGKILASGNYELPKSWFDQNTISWKPENLDEALIRQKLMSKDEITGGGLQLEVWTNKGGDHLLFKEGEIMKISVRANHECNLRLIYYLADGTKTLLDEFRIPADQVNKVVTLPNNYRCLSPFGAEMLQAVAQNISFTPLNITEKGGYKMINESTPGILANVRGFVIDSDQKLFAEQRLIITTIAK